MRLSKSQNNLLAMMKKSILVFLLCIAAPIVPGQGDSLKSGPYSPELSKEAAAKVAHDVAAWQIRDFPNQKWSKETGDWRNASLYLGMFDWSQTSGDMKYEKWVNGILDKRMWQPGKYMYHADDIGITQACLDFYMKYKKEVMLWPAQARGEWVVTHPCKNPARMIHYSSPQYERWSWADSLFMAPPVYARLYKITGDEKYMKFADEEFKTSYDYLFDKEENLFYRDVTIKKKREPNGEKVFWSRGNGWVMGGLVEILKQLPESDKKYRTYYEKLFRTMSARLIQLQRPDGSWSPGLLDSDSYPGPETSGTGFMIYAFAYGVNEGILPENKFLPAVRKGWRCLVSAVNEDGKLRWVQQGDVGPNKVTPPDNTEVYGVGTFLMAASEVYRLAK